MPSTVPGPLSLHAERVLLPLGNWTSGALTSGASEHAFDVILTHTAFSILGCLAAAEAKVGVLGFN